MTCVTWIETTGTIGLLVVALASGLVACGVAAAVKRMPSVAGTTLLLAAVTPFGVALLGALWCRQSIFIDIENNKHPNESMIDFWHSSSRHFVVLGAAAMLACAVVSVISLARARN